MTVQPASRVDEVKAATVVTEAGQYELTEVPLEELVAWNGNVRKAENQTALDELVANIQAHGILQSLVVKWNSKQEKYEVVAGKRRLRALNILLEQGAVTKASAIPCLIIPEGCDAAEISLAENIVRDQMHPADKFEAFKKLIDSGLSPDDVAVRFGVSRDNVTRLMRLAGVSEEIKLAYRAGEIDLEQVQAFAVVDDKARQLSYFKSFKTLHPHGKRPNGIRAALTKGDIQGTDKRALFVGKIDYEAGGGKTRSDLFSDGPSGTFFLNEKVLDKLVLDKLHTHRDRVLKEGWKWVDVLPSFDDYSDLREMGLQREYSSKTLLTPAAKAEEKRLQAAVDKLNDLDETTDEQDDELAALEAKIDAIRDEASVWSQGVKAKSGAIISVGDAGIVKITRGLIKKEDQKGRDAPQASSGSAPKAKKGQDTKLGTAAPLSAVLEEHLSHYRTASIAGALAASPVVALRLVVFTALKTRFYTQPVPNVQVRFEQTRYEEGLKKNGDSLGYEQLTGAVRKIKESIPPAGQLWEWLKKKSQDELIQILGVCTAEAFTAIDAPHCTAHSKSDLAKTVVEEIADLASKTLAIPKDYFERLSKPQLLSDLKEATGESGDKSIEALGKTQLVDYVAKKIKAGNPAWKPKSLRLPGYKAIAPKAEMSTTVAPKANLPVVVKGKTRIAKKSPVKVNPAPKKAVAKKPAVKAKAKK